MSETEEKIENNENEESTGGNETADTNTTEAPEERRKSFRLNKVLGATLISDDGEEKATRLFIIDISATGFRATDHSPPEQDECKIEIVLEKGQEPFRSVMRVVWVKELTVSGMYQMGCEFTDTEPAELERLTGFIEKESSKSGGAKTSGVSIGNNPWTMIR